MGQVLSEPKAHEPSPRSRAQVSPPACAQGCSSPVRRLGLREAETGPPQGPERKTGTSRTPWWPCGVGHVNTLGAPKSSCDKHRVRSSEPPREPHRAHPQGSHQMGF